MPGYINQLNAFAEKVTAECWRSIGLRETKKMFRQAMITEMRWIGAHCRRVDGEWMISVADLLGRIVEHLQPDLPDVTLGELAVHVAEGAGAAHEGEKR